MVLVLFIVLVLVLVLVCFGLVQVLVMALVLVWSWSWSGPGLVLVLLLVSAPGFCSWFLVVLLPEPLEPDPITLYMVGEEEQERRWSRRCRTKQAGRLSTQTAGGEGEEE